MEIIKRKIEPWPILIQIKINEGVIIKFFGFVFLRSRDAFYVKTVGGFYEGWYPKKCISFPA